MKTDDLLWRHWNIVFVVRHAIQFTNSKHHCLVEVGVGDGLSAFYALREIEQHSQVSGYIMHLYDTWGNLKKEDFERSETAYIYCNLDIERTKNNLSEFSSNLVFTRVMFQTHSVLTHQSLYLISILILVQHKIISQH